MDDLVLFVKVLLEPVEVIQYCLETFCTYSGEKVNATRLEFFFSKNVNYNKAKEINKPFGFTITSDLGIPLHHKKSVKRNF